VGEYVESLPAYQWFTALPTLISRLCHPSEAVAALLLNIVGKVVCVYPRQALWTIVSTYRSENKTRQKRAKEVLKKAIQFAQCARYGTDEGHLIKEQSPLHNEFLSLIEKLLKLSNDPVGKGVKSFRISTKYAVRCCGSLTNGPMTSLPDASLPLAACQALSRLRNVGVAIPTTNCFSVMLPPDGSTTKKHDGFASNLPQASYCSHVNVVMLRPVAPGGRSCGLPTT
jgi:hypothetical protein